MESLIKVNYDNERPTTSGRDLHEFLEIGTQYSIWFERMAEYGFAENIDFQAINQKRLTAQGNETALTDHQLTLEMAKEICMLQRNEKGKQARTYFIDLEKQWNSPEALMARALQMADQKIHHLSSIIEQDKPKVLFADSVSTSKTSILIGELAKIIKQNGYEIGEKRLFEWLRANGYLISRFGTDHNAPTQRAMELKLFEVKETIINHSSGFTTISKTTKVTGKGQQYLINKFLGESLQVS
jgi:anti-repressor protein